MKFPSRPNFSRRDFLKLGGLAVLTQLARRAGFRGRGSPGEAAEDHPNILFIVLDTLSARHMSLYGYSRETTPHIARFAEKAVVYHNHHAAGNFTTPGTASLLTGTYPWAHRAIQPSSPARDDFAPRNLFQLLPSDYYSLAYTQNPLALYLLKQFEASLSHLLPMSALTLRETTAAATWLQNDFILADAGENVITGIGQPPSSLFLSLLKPFGEFAPGLKKEYGDRFPAGLPGSNGRAYLLETTNDWLLTNLPTLPQPHCVYFHLMPPHEPYRPRREFIGAFQDNFIPPEKPVLTFSDEIPEETLHQYRRDYDEFLAYADAEFGRLVETLETNGQLENTYVILTSDHGQLFERGIHGHITPVMYDPVLHVPLLIHKPGQTQREDIEEWTSAVDLLPTILTQTDTSIPEWVEGQTLPGFNGNSDPDLSTTPRAIYALDAKTSATRGPITSGTAVILQEPYKLIRTFGYPEMEETYELYDLQSDPEELVNLVNTFPDVTREMRNTLISATQN